MQRRLRAWPEWSDRQVPLRFAYLFRSQVQLSAFDPQLKVRILVDTFLKMEFASNPSSSAPWRRTEDRTEFDPQATNRIAGGKHHRRCCSCLEHDFTRSDSPSTSHNKASTAPRKQRRALPTTDSPFLRRQDRFENADQADCSNVDNESAMDVDLPNNELPNLKMAATDFGLPSHADQEAKDDGMPYHGDFVNAAFDYDFDLDLDLDNLASPTESSGMLPLSLSTVAVAFEEPSVKTMNPAQLGDDSCCCSANGDSNTLPSILNHSSSLASTARGGKGLSSCSDGSRTCLIVALELLRTLHMPATTVCLSFSRAKSGYNASPRRIESVLSTNRAAIQTVSNILECQCSSSSEVQMILVIICGRITAWYKAIIHRHVDGSQTPSSTKWSFSPGTISDDEDHTELILDQPISVGGYNFDISLERRIRAQVVSSELQNVESLTEALTKRVEETRFGDLWNSTVSRSGYIPTVHSRESDETGLANTIHNNLTCALRHRLAATKAETKLILGSEHYPPSG